MVPSHAPFPRYIENMDSTGAFMHLSLRHSHLVKTRLSLTPVPRLTKTKSQVQTYDSLWPLWVQVLWVQIPPNLPVLFRSVDRYLVITVSRSYRSPSGHRLRSTLVVATPDR